MGVLPASLEGAKWSGTVLERGEAPQPRSSLYNGSNHLLESSWTLQELYLEGSSRGAQETLHWRLVCSV